MKKIILTLAILYPAAALAQGTAPADPPSIGGKPLVVVGAKKFSGGQERKRKALVARSEVAGLPGHRRCDQGTAELLRRDSYAPQPKPKAPAAKGVNDCRFLKEEDERLTCYNGFADKIPKQPR